MLVRVETELFFVTLNHIDSTSVINSDHPSVHISFFRIWLLHRLQRLHVQQNKLSPHPLPTPYPPIHPYHHQPVSKMTNVIQITSQPELMRKEGKNQSSIGSPLVERASRAASTTSTSANGVAIKTASEDNSNATLFFFLRALNRY